MIRSRVLVPAVALAAGLALAACGSSSPTASQSSTSPEQSLTQISPIPASSSVTAVSSPAAVATTPPALVGASAVPGVFGRQGAKPTIAHGSGTPPTTLLAHDVIVGTGATFSYGEHATANYTLQLYGGTPIQSSYDGGQAFPFSVPGQLIPGFSEGVLGMKVGGRRELVIPPNLGYGYSDANGIPGGSTLVFVVDLVSVG